MSALLPVVSPRLKLTVLGILLLGGALRLWTIGDGVPYTVGVDEPAIMEKALNSVRSGDFNPHFFDYPGVMFHAETAVIAVRFLDGAMSRGWRSLDAVWEGDFYLWCRIFVALVGTLTIYVVYRSSLRWGAAVGIIAALAMAVQPQHVLDSHFALTDTPLTFFVALTLLLSLRASEDGRTRAFLFAGLAAGFAAATKYNGLLAIVMPLAAALVASTTRPRVWALSAVAAGGVAGFLAGSPYSLLDLPNFLNNFAELSSHYNQPTSAWHNAATYVTYMRNWLGWPGVGDPYLTVYFTWPARLMLLVGVGLTAWRLRSRSSRAASLALLSFTLTYLWFIANQSMQYGRYALPLTPMLSLFLALGIVAARNAFAGTTASTRNRRLALAAPLLVLVLPLAQSIGGNVERRKVETKQQAAAWIVANVQPGEGVVIEDWDLRFPPKKIPSLNVDRLLSKRVAEYRATGAKYLVSQFIELNSYSRDPAYLELREATDLVQSFAPSREHPGRLILIFKIR